MASKIYEIILERRLTEEIETILKLMQNEFREGRCTHDHIILMKDLIEKTRRKGTNVYQALIGLEKAFGRISNKPRKFDPKEGDCKLKNAVININKKNKHLVRTFLMGFNEFVVKEDLRQRGVLNLVLFNIILDVIINQIKIIRET